MTHCSGQNSGRPVGREAANLGDGVSNLSLEQSQALSIGELAAAQASDLRRLQQEADAELRKARRLKEWIDGAIALKYHQRVQELRQQLGKATGTVHFDDDGVQVTAELPKKPVWDQRKLAEIAQRIVSSGDDPKEFMEVTYRVSERKYTAWPESLRQVFEPARTLKTGKPTFRLSVPEEK